MHYKQKLYYFPIHLSLSTLVLTCLNFSNPFNYTVVSIHGRSKSNETERMAGQLAIL